MKQNFTFRTLFFAFVIWLNTVHGQSSGTIPDAIALCYTGDRFYPSNRLANSLDNLIFLIEKVEAGLVQYNLPIDASSVATVLLRRFQKNGIMDSRLSDLKSVNDYEAKQQDLVWSLLPNATFTFPESTLTDEKEPCSLHWMLSTSINETKDYFYDAYSSYSYGSDVTFFPKLNGAIHAGRYGTLSGGPLLAGIAASSLQRQFTVRDLLYDYEQTQVTPTSLLDQPINAIVGSTVGAELAQTAIMYSVPKSTTGYKHSLVGPSGTWNGTNCATTYSLDSNETTYATQAELLGATDGMIIGDFLKSTYYSVNDPSPPTLSQVLRSYYGRGLQYNSLSACDRSVKAQTFSNEIQSSGTGFGIAYRVKGAYNDEYPFPNTLTAVGTAMSAVVSNYSATYLQTNAFSCDQSIQNLKCQTQNDIFIVMDTSAEASANNFQEQKNFIGTLIGRIGVYPNDSHVGILTFGSNAQLVQFSTTISGAYIRCQLQWNPNLYVTTTDVSNAVRNVQNELRDCRNDQRSYNVAQAPGKVVIFIYLRSSMSDGDRVKAAMSSLRTEFPDVTTLAVGTNKQALQYFVTQDTDIFMNTGEQLSYVVDNIIKRLCTVPSSLEYRDCKYPNTATEKQLIGDTYIYPDTYQWVALNQQTMNLSSSLKLYFISTYGKAQACVSRSISSQTPTTNCFEVSDSIYTYNVGGTCNNYNSLNSCPPVFIGVKGQSSSTEKCTERACHSWNQVKVSISHQGAQCSSYRFLSTIQVVFACLLWNWWHQYFC